MKKHILKILAAVMITAVAFAAFAGCAGKSDGGSSAPKSRTAETRSKEEIEATGLKADDVIAALDKLVTDLYPLFYKYDGTQYTAINFTKIMPLIYYGEGSDNNEYPASTYSSSRNRLTNLGSYSTNPYSDSYDYDEETYKKYSDVDTIGFAMKVTVFRGSASRTENFDFIYMPRYLMQSLFDAVNIKEDKNSFRRDGAEYTGTPIDAELIRSLPEGSLSFIYYEFIPAVREILIDSKYDAFLTQYDIFAEKEDTYDENGRILEEKIVTDGVYAGKKTYAYGQNCKAEYLYDGKNNQNGCNVYVYYGSGAVKTVIKNISRYSAEYMVTEDPDTVNSDADRYFESGDNMYFCAYDEQGRVIKESANSRSYSYEYDGDGKISRLAKRVRGKYNYETEEWTEEWNEPEFMPYPCEIESFYRGYFSLDENETGWYFTIDFERDEGYEFQYDGAGRLIKAVENKNHDTGQEFEYDARGNLILNIVFYNGTQHGVWEKFEYDENDRLIKYLRGYGVTSDLEETFEYDADGNLTRVLKLYKGETEARVNDAPPQGLVGHPYAMAYFID